jgi:hypothetical protein
MMGQRRSREQKITARVQELRSYLLSFQYALKALMKALPEHVLHERPPFASLGRFEIWPCLDAAVVLMYPADTRGVEIVVRPSTGKSHSEFLGTSEVGAYYKEGNETPESWRPVFSVNDASNHIVYMADPFSEGHLGLVRPKFTKLFVFGWDAPLPQPDEEALVAIRADLARQNLVRGQGRYQHEAVQRAESLLSAFKDILTTSKREEDAQKFLASYPELLYPDYVACHPKMALGEEYKTDYVLLVQGSAGQEYVFVEIERPGKPIFVAEGHFSHHFTQAKDQLLQWSSWIKNNYSYLERKLPGLGRPTFHLVMGRSSELGQGQRERLQEEFTPTGRRFSTYDDLADRFAKIVETLLT